MAIAPDFSVLRMAITREGIPARVPLYEHSVDYETMSDIMGWSDHCGWGLPYWRRAIEFYCQMGYDFAPVEMGPRFPALTHLVAADTAGHGRELRGWADENCGPIRTMADFERATWPAPEDAFDYAMFEEVCSYLPDGMKIIGGCGGGPFEHTSFLMGLVPLSMALADDPELVESLSWQVGSTLVEIARCLAPLRGIGAYRFGDDMGYKNGTMLSPRHLRQYFLPWQKEIVQVAHAAGKPFVLHSCGNLALIMDDLVDDVGIDAKHSWEDVIMPVDQAKAKWGDRIGILGGVDIDFMCRHSAQQVKDYTLVLLEACAPGGGFALGSGNSIANYVPVDNYLAMLGALREYNGR